MVVFTCNHCGESLHKPRVEKHYMQCRKFKSLTCVDCLKDFKGDEYVVHIKCVTEEERYAAKGSIPNGIVKKGDVKQESWMDMIQTIVDNENSVSPSVKNLLDIISNYSNVPRKKQKFINFVKSSTGGRINFKDIQSVWDIIESYKQKQKQTKTIDESKLEETTNDNTFESKENKRKSSNEDECVEVPKKKKKKSKVSEDDTANLESNELATNEVTNKFNFQEKILSILSAKGSISLKKLQKKVLNAYLKQMGETECTEKIRKKIYKKLKKLENVEICDETVQLNRNVEA